MKTQSPDTHPEAERVQIDLLRKAGTARRLALGLSFSQEALQIAKTGIRRANPNATDEQVNFIFIEATYGKALADRVRTYLASRP